MFNQRFTLIALLVFVLVFPIYFVGPKALQVRNTINTFETPRAAESCARMAVVLLADLATADHLQHLEAILAGRGLHVMTAPPHKAEDVLREAAHVSPGGIGLISIAEASREALHLMAPSETPIRGRWLIQPPLDVQILYGTLAPTLNDRNRRDLMAYLAPLLPAADQRLLETPRFDRPTELSRAGLSLWRLVFGTDPGLTVLLTDNLTESLRTQFDAWALEPARTTAALQQTVLIYDTSWAPLQPVLRNWLGQDPRIRFLPVQEMSSGSLPRLSWPEYASVFLTLYGVLDARDATTVAHDQMGHPTCLPL